MTTVELTSPSELVLCPGETLELAVNGTFESYAWSNGASTASIEVGEAGLYSVVVYDADGCAAISESIAVQVITAQAPEVQVVGELTFCAGNAVEFIGPNGAEWTWSNGETTQSITVTESGTYSLILIDECGNDNPSEEFVVEVLDAPDVPSVTVPDVVNADEAFTLTSSSASTRWYDDEMAVNPLFIGAAYETSISETTTLWVEDINDSGLEEGNGGRMGMGQGQYHDNSVRWLLFDAYQDLVIHTVDVYANGAGEREIGVIDAEGNVLASGVFDLTDGMNTLTLDFEVPAGTNYGLRSFADDPQLWRDGPGTDMAYPYELGTLGSITQSTAGGNNATNYYYFFYNWVVQTPFDGCPSDRVPVTITVVGLDEASSALESVYPNPTTGTIQLTANAAFATAEWSLLNALGQEVAAGQLNGTVNVLDFTPQAVGQYMLQVRNENEVHTVQLIIE